MAVVSVKRSIGQALSPLLRFDYKLHGISDKRQNSNDLDDMQKSTRQFTLSNRQALSPLVRIDYELRWLDIVFQGEYLPSLSINYVAINNVLEKLPPQLYYVKMKICYDQGCNGIGVAIATK